MILIRSVKVADGTGKPAYTADILVRGDRIAGIGSFPSAKAETVLEGLGCYATPGFIDIHTDIDHSLSLFSNPLQSHFLEQGVTTVIGGNCGSSLAPLLYGTLESIQKWTDVNQVNVDWHTVAEFLSVLERKRIGVNFGTLVGHSTVRRALLGDVLRDLTEKEIAVFGRALTQGLEEGAFGLSTGLGFSHSRQTPVREIEYLADIVKNHDAVYATHLRDEGAGLCASVEETIAVASRTGARTIISHLRPLQGAEDSYRQVLELLAKAPAHVYFDIYPSDVSIIPVYQLLPQWAQRGGLAAMLEHLFEPVFAARVQKELPPLKKDDVTIIRAPGNEFLDGKSIGEFARNQGVTIAEAVLKLMIATRLKAVILYRNLNEALVQEALQHPRAIITCNSEKLPMCAFSSYLKTIGSLEEAVRKITALPAQFLQLRERGELKEGNFADLVLVRDHQPETVILNGLIAVQQGKATGMLEGKILRR